MTAVQKQLSQTDSSKVLLLSLVIFPLTCCFSKTTDWKLQALKSTKLIRLWVKSNRGFFCEFLCSTPLGGNLL